MWNYQSGNLVYRLPGHKGCTNDIDFHPSEPIGASPSSPTPLAHTHTPALCVWPISLWRSAVWLQRQEPVPRRAAAVVVSCCASCALFNRPRQPPPHPLPAMSTVEPAAAHHAQPSLPILKVNLFSAAELDKVSPVLIPRSDAAAPQATHHTDSPTTGSAP